MATHGLILRLAFGWLLATCLLACSPNEQAAEEPVTLDQLADWFEAPPMAYRPYVWWHWMGSNFSKEGITKDLEAMKEAGIAGATIFNLSSAVQETHHPIAHNPWPEQTYRSAAYWEAMRHAAAEAERLGLKLGLHNTPGYSTTGGPWITEKRGMQRLVWSETKLTGGESVCIDLSRPELPVYEGWGTTHQRATYYRDVAVMALPDTAEVSVEQVVNLTAHMDSTGRLSWQAPAGEWRVFRMGHAPTMANPHPLPDELIGKVLEADKMSEEQSRYHWQQVLDPLVMHLRDYIGRSFTHILIDSYEAGDQDWTAEFAAEFQRLKGYDPLPFLALRAANAQSDTVRQFEEDYRAVINRLFLDKGWKVAVEQVHQAGLQLYWEPYTGPFSTWEATTLADLPMGEFWTGSSGAISKEVVEAAKESGKRIVGAEAFTSRPERSQYTEDPAFLKHSADGAFRSGANRLFLHHWVHQPFDDIYQPGMGMGWWGTHFSRHQTWIRPGKAFFTYLSRSQMLLQESEFVSSDEQVLHRSRSDAEIYFLTNPADTVSHIALRVARQAEAPQCWDPYRGVIRAVEHWENEGDSIRVTCLLQPDEALFVIVPKQSFGYAASISPALSVCASDTIPLEGAWSVRFEPKLDSCFERTLPALVDFSQAKDPKLRYFAGTATYSRSLKVVSMQQDDSLRYLLDLGELHDLAEVFVNGQRAGTLWAPPYWVDLTPGLRPGENQLEVAVTTNWANRLIGDEQYPADFEWGEDRGPEMGRAMKAFPEWFLRGEPRPSKGRKAFLIWYYHRPDSPLQPAGWIGPVKFIKQQVQEEVR